MKNYNVKDELDVREALACELKLALKMHQELKDFDSDVYLFNSFLLSDVRCLDKVYRLHLQEIIRKTDITLSSASVDGVDIEYIGDVFYEDVLRATIDVCNIMKIPSDWTKEKYESLLGWLSNTKYLDRNEPEYIIITNKLKEEEKQKEEREKDLPF